MIRVLVDGPAFWASLRRDLEAARESIDIQTLSLEGDDTGRCLAETLAGVRPVPARILVDSFTKYVVGQRFRFGPRGLLSRSTRGKAADTRALFDRLRASGVQLRFTNPLRAFLHRLPARDHKKLIVIDRRVAYIGGMNFTDHNFRWHDMMLRIEDARVARLLATDFQSTWEGRRAASTAEFRGIELRLLDGRSNESAFRRVFELIDGAQESVWVQSPYLTFPFCERLGAATRRGVRVTVITPESSNQPILQTYILRAGARLGFQVRLLPGPMTHLKGMLIDGRWLVAGSSNFDYLSYHLFQEILAIIDEPDAVAEFTRAVVAVDQARSRAVRCTSPAIGRHLVDRQLRVLGRVAVAMARL